MNNPVTPEITIEITLHPSEAGGRKSAISQGEYRGVLGVGSENFSVRFFVQFAGGLSPNQKQRLGVQFLVPEVALPLFRLVQCSPSGRGAGRGLDSNVLNRVCFQKITLANAQWYDSGAKGSWKPLRPEALRQAQSER